MTPFIVSRLEICVLHTIVTILFTGFSGNLTEPSSSGRSGTESQSSPRWRAITDTQIDTRYCASSRSARKTRDEYRRYRTGIVSPDNIALPVIVSRVIAGDHRPAGNHVKGRHASRRVFSSLVASEPGRLGDLLDIAVGGATSRTTVSWLPDTRILSPVGSLV